MDIPDPRSTSAAGLGWRVYGWAGDDIGEVIERRGSLLVVRLKSITGDEVRIPIELISDEDADAKRVTLAVDTSELEGVDPHTSGISLTSDSD